VRLDDLTNMLLTNVQPYEVLNANKLSDCLQAKIVIWARDIQDICLGINLQIMCTIISNSQWKLISL